MVRADPVVAALTPESRTVLLPLLGRLGGPKALAAVKESLASDSKEQKSAAVTALTNWPDETVAAEAHNGHDGHSIVSLQTNRLPLPLARGRSH